MEIKYKNTQSTLLGIIFLGLFLQFTSSFGQSPYSIAPKWYFGRQGGMDFSGGAPVVMNGGMVDGMGQESSSTMCDQNGMFYSIVIVIDYMMAHMLLNNL